MKDMLCEINHSLVDLVHDQISNLEEVNTKEMNKAIHMIKNLEEAIYYCTIVEAMEEGQDVSAITVNTATNGAINTTSSVVK